MILCVKNENLSVLFNQPASVIQDFCKLILDYLSKGQNQKQYINIAQKIGVGKEVVQNAVEELVYLLIESHRKKFNNLDFREAILTKGFNEEQTELLSNIYSQLQTSVPDILETLKNNQFPHFVDLEWRFETKIASRSLLNQCEPLVSMKLTTADFNTSKSVLLQTEPAVLLNITNKLKDALKEANSVQSKRVCRKFS